MYSHCHLPKPIQLYCSVYAIYIHAERLKLSEGVLVKDFLCRVVSQNEQTGSKVDLVPTAGMWIIYSVQNSTCAKGF